MGRVRVELYGIPRLRAGRPTVEVEAATLGEALEALERDCPGLGADVIVGGRLHPACRASDGAERFVDDPAERLDPARPLILLSADAGG